MCAVRSQSSHLRRTPSRWHRLPVSTRFPGPSPPAALPSACLRIAVRGHGGGTRAMSNARPPPSPHLWRTAAAPHGAGRAAGQGTWNPGSASHGRTGEADCGEPCAQLRCQDRKAPLGGRGSEAVAAARRPSDDRDLKRSKGPASLAAAPTSPRARLPCATPPVAQGFDAVGNSSGARDTDLWKSASARSRRSTTPSLCRQGAPEWHQTWGAAVWRRTVAMPDHDNETTSVASKTPPSWTR